MKASPRPQGFDRVGDQHGGATLELALFLPALLLAALAGAFALRLLLDYGHLNHVSEAGVRYATRVALDPTRPGEYRLRPTVAEVEAYIREIADVPLSAVAVSPDPATALPGTEVVVAVTARRDLGPAGRAASALARLVGAGDLFPDGGVVITATAAMREE